MRPYRVKITCNLYLVVLLHGILFFIGASDKQNKNENNCLLVTPQDRVTFRCY